MFKLKYGEPSDKLWIETEIYWSVMVEEGNKCHLSANWLNLMTRKTAVKNNSVQASLQLKASVLPN